MGRQNATAGEVAVYEKGTRNAETGTLCPAADELGNENRENCKEPRMEFGLVVRYT